MRIQNIRWAAALASMAALPLAAQTGCRFADLGVQDMECRSCRIDINDDQVRTFRTGTELRLGRIRPNGPTANVLRDGDVLVAIDGEPITTAEGGRRFAALAPGRATRLTVRRDGENRDVRVVPGAQCHPSFAGPRPPAPPRPPAAPRPQSIELEEVTVVDAPPMPATPPAPPRPRVRVRPPNAPPPPPPRADAPPAPPAPPQPRIRVRPPNAPPQAPPAPPRPGMARGPNAPPPPPRPPVPPRPPEFLPDGWFGFGIGCRACEIRSENGRNTFTFRSQPTVENVEPGTPAARAGLQRGDRLTHIDGLAITTPQGWRRFGGVQPGQRVRWSYTRNGREQTSELVAVRRPDARAAARAPSAAADQRLRYSGAVGGADVEVRGAPVTVSRDPRTGETVIRSTDLTVRIRPNR